MKTGIFILTKIWLRLYYQADQILHLSKGNEQKSVIVESEKSTKVDEKDEVYTQHLDDAIAAYRKIREFAIGRDLTEKEQAVLDKECEVIIQRECIQVDPIHKVIEIPLEGKGKIKTGPPTLTRFENTERMLRALGVPGESNGTTASLTPVESIPGFRMDVPGDPSAAAFLAAAALLAGREECVLRHVAVNPTRTGFLPVLKRMGAGISLHDRGESLGEPVADLVVRRGKLRGTTVTAEEVPALIDEIPVLAVLAATAAGVTTFHGVGELRVKESDRLGLLEANLRAVGVQCEAYEDSLTVEGTEAPPKGAVETGLDHRMAMAFAVLGRVPGAAIRLSEYASPGVSYPGFFDDLDRVAPAG